MAQKELRVRSSTLAAVQSTYDEAGLTEVMRHLISRAAR